MKTNEITTEVIELTPQKAHALLGKNINNRSLRHRQVEKYARDILTDSWQLTGEAIQVDWDGNLLNGQHRCHAVIMADKPIKVLLITGLDPETQSVIDVAIKRTAVDALRWAGFSGDLTVLAKMARIDLGWHSAQKITTLTTNGAFPFLTHTEIVNWVSNNPASFASAKFGQKAFSELGFTPSVLAYAHYLMTQVDELACDIFWSELLEMRTGGIGDPRVTMTRILRSRREDQKLLPDGLQLFYAVRAWNAWRSGETLSKMPAMLNNKPIEVPQPI
jgi:hypothetical protein